MMLELKRLKARVLLHWMADKMELDKEGEPVKGALLRDEVEVTVVRRTGESEQRTLTLIYRTDNYPVDYLLGRAFWVTGLDNLGLTRLPRRQLPVSREELMLQEFLMWW